LATCSSVDEPAATPTHARVFYIDAIGSLRTYVHAQFVQNSIRVEYIVIISPLYTLLLRYGYMQQHVDRHTATPTHAHVYYIDAIGSLRTYMHAQCSKISNTVEYGVI
jgi:hypothetical protein